MEKSQRRDSEVTGHIVFIHNEKTEKRILALSSLSPFSKEMVPPTFKIIISSSFKPWYTHPEMCLLNDSNDSQAAKDDEPLKLHPLQILTSP